MQFFCRFTRLISHYSSLQRDFASSASESQVKMLSPSKTNDDILGMSIVPFPTTPTTLESSSSSSASSSSSSASSLGQSQNLPPALPIDTADGGSKGKRSKTSFRLFLLFLLISVVTSTTALAIVLAVRLAYNKTDPNIADSTTSVQGPYPSDRLSPTVAPALEMSKPAPAPSASGGLRSPRGCAALPMPPPFEGKKGAAFTLRDEGLNGSWVENLPKVVALDPYWNYGWGLELIDQQPDNIEFVPMVWGGRNPDRVQQKLTRNLLPLVESGKIKRLLGFNEPDKAEQSNMNTTDALASWPILESTGLPLASPSCAQPAGKWMVEFMSAAEDRCHRLDWISVHWYGGANAGAFKQAMQNIYELYGSRRPLLITEFAPADWKAETPAQNKWSQADVLGFMKQALPWLEETDWISGYAWFSFETSSAAGTSSALFDEQGALTACGRFYASVRTNNPSGDQTITA